MSDKQEIVKSDLQMLPIKQIDYQKLIETAKKTGLIHEVLPQPFKFEEKGDQLIGKLIHIIPDIPGMNEGKFNVYIFDTPRGLFSTALGSVVDTQSSLMVLNHVFAIEYQGDVQTRNGFSMHSYRVVDFGDYNELMKAQSSSK